MMEDANKKTILVIEDEPDVQFYLQTILENVGFKVLTAGDGVTGLKLIREQKPDLISLDLILPKKSGRKVLNALKKDEELSQIPVLIVTAHADDDLGNEEACTVLDSILKPPNSGQGPGKYLHKPIKPLEYIQCIEEILGIESKTETKLRLAAKSEMDSLMRKAKYETLQAALKVLRNG
jgi:CheY-like chemotaxis protein